MMYHFMFGLRGCSPAPAAASGGMVGGAPALAAASFLVSSVIKCCQPETSRPAPQFLTIKELQQVTQPELNHSVDHPEEGCEDEHGDDDHRRRSLHFFAAGIVDLLHLGADFFEKVLGAVRPRL